MPSPGKADVGSTIRADAHTASRYVYCFGDPNWSYWRSVDDGTGEDGWWYNETSSAWGRQFPFGLPQRVRFDDSVSVMQSVRDSLGRPCHTVKAEIQPNDPDPNGGTASQRTAIMGDSVKMADAFYGSRPPITPQPGESWWYGFAFATNAGYSPHYDATFGNWNTLFSWHDSPINGSYSHQANIGLEVATLGPSSGALKWRCGTMLRRLARPRLAIELNGGNRDDSTWPNEDGQFTCRRYLGPVFRPGHLYRIQMHVSWDAYMHGTLQVWVDGTEYVDATGISDVWYSGSTVDTGIYPIFENYRAYDTSLPTNDVYYGGLIKGSTQTDVTIVARPKQA